MALPMSESFPPGTITEIAASSAPSVVFTSRSASALGAIPPTNTVTAESEWNPCQMAPKSSDSRSPSSSRRAVEGIPCTISSFTEAQIVAGNGRDEAPRYPLKEGVAPCSAMYCSAARSRSRVVRPGATASSTRLIVPATIRPAVRILSSSSGDFRMIICSLASDRVTERGEHALGDGVHPSLRVDVAEESPLRVVALQRFGLLPVDREASFDRQFVLVAALLQGGSVHVTELIVGRRPPLLMVRALADRAGVATDDAPDRRRVGDREL